MDIGARIKELRVEKRMTQEQLAERISSTKQAVFKYENGIVTNIPMNKIIAIAAALNVSPSYLMGWETSNEEIDVFKFDNIMPITVQKIPLLGEISCGKPIYTEEDRESYVLIGTDLQVDFCLKCKGDSMIGARIYDGDIVFIRKQEIVNNGEIAAVIIDNEATLKRVYYYPDKGKLLLQPENPKYEPLIYVGDELNEIHILGKAIAFQSDVI